MRTAHPLVLAAVLLVSLGACTPTPAPTPSAPTVAADARRDINPVARDLLSEGGNVRLVLTSLPTQWNPRHPDATADLALLLDPVAPTHFTLDAAGRAEPNPDFVTRVDVTHDGQTVVSLRLNPDAVWGDATAVTAADWVATWRAQGRARGALAAAGWDAVADVRQGESPTDVVLTYRGIEPDWAEPLVAGPLRADSVSDAAAWGWDSYRPERYAGPFVVAFLDVPQGVVTLERNPLWWGDPPRLERVIFRTVQTEAHNAAYQHNELDLLALPLSADRLEQARAALDSTVRTAPSPLGRRLDLATDGVLADAALRRALVRALDRDAVAAAALAGLVEEPSVWSDTLMLPNEPGYADQGLATGLDHDTAGAASALDSAGWVLSEGRRVRDGVPLALTYAVDPADALSAREFAAVSAQLAALGIAVTAVTADADLTPVTVRVSPFPLAHLPAEATADPELAALAQRVSTEVDPVRRADQASQLSRLLWLRAYDVPLYQLPQNVATRTGLANVGAPSYATTAWEDVGWAR